MLTHLILSDLHLGAETSLLTELGPKGEPIYDAPSAVLVELAARMRGLVQPGEQPTIVLAGDVLELALADTDQAAKTFECLLDALFPAGADLFSPRVLYLPGNHDHHVWEMAREDHYAEFLLCSSTITPPWHVTRMYESPNMLVGWPHSRLLDALAQRHAKRQQRATPLDLCVVYPNLGLLDGEGKRSVVISHGHFVERLYHLMSELQSAIFPERAKPRSIVELEAENFAWIDFFWSTMGRSGDVGEDVQHIYELASHEQGRDHLAARLSKAIVETWLSHDGVPDIVERKLLHVLLRKLAETIDARERGTFELLGDDTRAGLKAYLEGPLYHQIAHERRHRGMPPEGVTFVFGHTHKPLERVLGTTRFTKPLHVFNTGGWVIDTVDPQPHHGAAIVAVDEQMNVASLRLFNQVARAAIPAAPRVVFDDEQPERTHALMDRLRDHLATHADAWRGFSAKVGSAAESRAEALARRSGRTH